MWLNHWSSMRMSGGPFAEHLVGEMEVAQVRVARLGNHPPSVSAPESCPDVNKPAVPVGFRRLAPRLSIWPNRFPSTHAELSAQFSVEIEHVELTDLAIRHFPPRTHAQTQHRLRSMMLFAWKDLGVGDSAGDGRFRR